MRALLIMLAATTAFAQGPVPSTSAGASNGGATLPITTSALKGDGAGGGAAVTGTSTNCVHVDGTSAACPGGGGTGNAANEVAVAFSATPTFTCGSASAGTATHFTVAALTGNITSSTLATCTAGQTIGFHFVQNVAGSWTVAMPANWDSLTIDATASTATEATYWYDGTNGRLVSVNGKATPFLIGQAPERAAPTHSVSCPSGSGAEWFDSTNHAPTFCSNNAATNFVAPIIKAARTANQFITNIDATGAQQPAAIAAADLPAALSSSTSINGSTVPSAAGLNRLSQTIASGTSALGTSAIASGACATVVTTAATGTASTDAIVWTPNGSIKAITGYVPATTGGLSIAAYPTANNVNFDVCNWTSGSITPGPLTLNWGVIR